MAMHLSFHLQGVPNLPSICFNLKAEPYPLMLFKVVITSTGAGLDRHGKRTSNWKCRLHVVELGLDKYAKAVRYVYIKENVQIFISELLFESFSPKRNSWAESPETFERIRVRGCAVVASDSRV